MIVAELIPVLANYMSEIDCDRLKFTCDSHRVVCYMMIFPKSGKGLIPTYIVYDARGC